MSIFGFAAMLILTFLWPSPRKVFIFWIYNKLLQTRKINTYSRFEKKTKREL